MPLLGIYPEEIKAEKDTWTLVFIAALYTIAKTGKQPGIDRWMDKGAVVHIYDGILLLLLLLLSRFSRVRLYVTPEMAAHQAPPSLGFSRQEHWSGLPFPSPTIEYYSAIKNNAICSNMDRPRDYHTEWSQTEKDKYYIISLPCGFWKIMQINLYTK